MVGPSGSGKSSLLLMLGGMLAPSSGEVFYREKSLYPMAYERRAQWRRESIGFVFQTFNLVPYLTAIENVQLPLMRQKVEPVLQEDVARGLLARFGLDHRLDHLPAELSVGQKQRVAMARTLANDPEVILADESTGNLDLEMCECVRDFLLELQLAGRAVVMVTHDLGCAQRGSRVLTIEEGRMQNVA